MKADLHEEDMLLLDDDYELCANCCVSMTNSRNDKMMDPDLRGWIESAVNACCNCREYVLR